MKKAMYVFSADPIHYGHIDIIKRAAKVFDKVIVAIGANPSKNTMFELDERLDMVNKAIKDIKNTEVASFSGLLVDYAYENDIPVIIKSIRNIKDTDYEKLLHQSGQTQKLDIDTYVLFARPELSHISSTMVKSLQKEQGLIHELVPLHVKQCLEIKASKQYIIGITGEISTGKSYISKKLEQIGKQRSIPVHHIELDHIPHQIYDKTLKEPEYEKIRNNIIKTFGENIKQDGKINRKLLGEIVFNNPEKLKQLNKIMAKPIEVRLKRELYGKQGLIIINAALLAESNMTYLSNNNIILVTADKQSQEKRLKQKKFTNEQIQKRLASQYNAEEKKRKIRENIEKHNNGKLWIIDNSDGSNEDIEKLFDKITEYIKLTD